MSAINIKAVRKEASAALSNKRSTAVIVNQDEEDEEMIDQSEEIASQQANQKVIPKEEVKKVVAPQATVSLHGFSDKLEIADITDHIVNKLNLQLAGLPSKLTAGRGSVT